MGAVFFALLFSVAAMMMQSFRERTSELAVLKTLGFSDHKIFWIILLEALILCIAATPRPIHAEDRHATVRVVRAA